MGKLVLVALLLAQTMLCPVRCVFTAGDACASENESTPCCCSNDSHEEDSPVGPLEPPHEGCECYGCFCEGAIIDDRPDFEIDGLVICCDVCVPALQIDHDVFASASLRNRLDHRPVSCQGRDARSDTQVWLL